MRRQSFRAQIALVLRVGSPPRYAGPAIISLGLAAAVLEGLGLLLFIPLIQRLGAAPHDQAGALQRLERIFPSLSAESVAALLVALLCASILLKNLVSLLNLWVTRQVDGMVAHRLRTTIFAQIFSSCIDYRAGIRRADIATTLSTNSWKVSNALTLLYRMVVSSLTFIVFIGLMLCISPPLTLVAIVALSAAAMVIRFSTRKANAVGQAVVEENKQFGQRIWESIDSLQLIRAFGREAYERSRFDAASDKVRGRLIALDMLWALPGPISEVAIVLVIGGLVLAAKPAGVEIAALAAFLSLLYRLQNPARDLMQSKVALDGMLPAVTDVDDLLTASATPLLADGPRRSAAPQTAISFRDVWYRYGPDEPWALQNVSFDIPARGTTAIVGESGAGKSTILALLFRFQDPGRGTVECDGVPLTEFRVDDWRGRLALMSQDVQLFHDTVAANIGYGRAGAHREEIRAAARVARADRFITDLPNGYDTVVGDQGVRLSGGERQRIALARSVLRGADLLILDEATNALDVESEHAFQTALEDYARERTVVVVAHRLSTVRDADHVVVLGQGRVIEAGPPERLMRDQGRFARMFELQQGRPPHQAAEP